MAECRFVLETRIEGLIVVLSVVLCPASLCRYLIVVGEPLRKRAIHGIMSEDSAAEFNGL